MMSAASRSCRPGRSAPARASERAITRWPCWRWLGEAVEQRGGIGIGRRRR